MNKSKVLLPEAILILGKKKGIIRILGTKRKWKINATQRTGEMQVEGTGRLVIRVLKHPCSSSLSVAYSPNEHEEKSLFTVLSSNVEGQTERIRVIPTNGFEESPGLVTIVKGIYNYFNQLLPPTMRLPEFATQCSSGDVCY